MPSAQPKPRGGRRAREVVFVAGLTVAGLWLLATAGFLGPEILYGMDGYPGAVNAVSAPCHLMSPQIAHRLVPGARPIRVGAGCGWYAPGKSWKGGDAAEIGFDPTAWSPGALPWQTPVSQAHDDYRSMVSFGDWRPVPDVGDEASINRPSEMLVRNGNVTWMLTADSNVKEPTLVAAARAIGRSLARQAG